jgi:malonate-semialdehyde dehydrogenase (acetylating)/methylmalonate-semialdehyde dehydrogenase
MAPQVLKNYIDGEWVESKSKEMLDVRNPATAEVIARVPLSTTDEVASAIQAAKAAFQGWRETTPYTRARYMFELKNVMEDRFEELAAVIVKEHGKIIDEARSRTSRWRLGSPHS